MLQKVGDSVCGPWPHVTGHSQNVATQKVFLKLLLGYVSDIL